MLEGLDRLVVEGEDFFAVINCSRNKVEVKPLGRAITISKYRTDRELRPKIIRRAPNGADAYTISSGVKIPTNFISQSIRVYAV